MAIITRKISNNLGHSFTIPCPGEISQQNANLVIPASVVDLDLLTLCTEDTLWALQSLLLSLVNNGAITVTGTLDTSSLDYDGISTIQADANPPLNNAVTLASGTNITLSQVGQTISIAATGDLSLPLTNNHIFVGQATNVLGDVAMSNDASIVASGAVTVNSVGGSSASNIHSAELAANSATNLDTVSTIVKRDGSGDFAAGTITASLIGHASLDLALIGGILSGALGIGETPVASAILDVASTTQGFLPPRMSTAQRTAISSPAEGLEVYDLDLHQLYMWNGSNWVILG